MSSGFTALDILQGTRQLPLIFLRGRYSQDLDHKLKFTDWASLNTPSTQREAYANAKCLWFYQTNLVLLYVRNKLFTTGNLHIRSALLGWKGRSVYITVHFALWLTMKQLRHLIIQHEAYRVVRHAPFRAVTHTAC